MSAPVVGNPETTTGYRLDQLATAFDRVMNPRDWKAEIRSVIPVADRHLVETAVVWFTDSVPAFAIAPEDNERLLITAPGYRLGRSAE